MPLIYIAFYLLAHVLLYIQRLACFRLPCWGIAMIVTYSAPSLALALDCVGQHAFGITVVCRQCVWYVSATYPTPDYTEEK